MEKDEPQERCVSGRVATTSKARADTMKFSLVRMLLGFDMVLFCLRHSIGRALTKHTRARTLSANGGSEFRKRKQP